MANSMKEREYQSSPLPGGEMPDIRQFKIDSPKSLLGSAMQTVPLPVSEIVPIGSVQPNIEKYSLKWENESTNNPKMMAGAKDDDDKDIDFYRLLQMGGRGATNLTADLGESLRTMAEKGFTPENLEKTKILYSETMNECLGSMWELYEKNVISDEKNAYPYDYRTSEFMLQNISQAITSLERAPWMKESKEGQVFLAELKQDVAWMEDFLHVTVAQTASLPYKFDIIMQMQLLKEGRYCAFITNDQMESLAYATLPGRELTNDQKKTKIDKKIGLHISEEYTKLTDEGNPLIEGPVNLREIGIKMYAASLKTRMNLAAASQADLTSYTPEKTTFKGDNLSKEDFDFYHTLFWDKKEGQFLTPYITSKGEHNREYTTILEACLIKNAHFRLKDITQSKKNQAEKDAMVSGLTKEVKAEALKRRESWTSRQEKDVVSMLASLITQQGLLQDFSFGHSYQYCWEPQWELDSSDKPRSKKNVDFGGIYTPSGDFPSLGWARRKHVYDGMGNSCTKFPLPTSSVGRAEVSLYSPFEMPGYTSFVEEVDEVGNKIIKELEVPLEIANSNDQFLIEQWKFLFSNEDQYVKERREMGYDSLHPEIAKQLKEWAFKWVTPYTSNYLGEDVKYNIEVPHLMPPTLGNIANLFDSITTGSRKLNFGGKSVWKELIEGKETYEIEWGKLETQFHSRWKVDMDMASRYMKVLIEPVDESKDPILGLIWSGPGTFGPKELAKRLRLSMRDSDDAPSTAHEIALIPFMVVMACAQKYGIGGAYGWEQTEKEDIDTGTTNADRFFTEMAYWKRALKWLPGDRPSKDKYDDTLKYGNEMALLAEFYEAILSRMHKASSEESFYLAKRNLDKTAERLNKLGHLNKGSFKFTIDKKKALYR